MAEKSLQARIQNKCDTTANWAKATNFVPKKGEIIVYSDGGGTGVPKMKVGDGTSKVGSLKFADEGQYLPLAGGKLTGPLSINDYMTIDSVAGGGSDFSYYGIVFHETSAGSNNDSARIIFQYRRSTSGAHTTRIKAPEFEGKLIGNADTATTATTASKVANALSINGKTYNGSAAIDVGVIGAEYGGSGQNTLAKSAEAYVGALSEAATSYALNDEHKILTNIPAGTSTYKIPLSNFYTYMKGKMDSIYQAKGTYLTSLPIASSSTLGGVKIGSGLTVAEDGTISAAAEYTLPTASSTTKGGIKVGSGLTMSSETLNHSNSITAKTAYGSTATTASANGGKIVVTDVKYDAQGHITGSTDRTITLSQATYTLAGLMGSTAKGSATQPVYWNGTAWTNTTYTLGKSVPADAKFTDTVYSLPTASSTLGGVKTTSTVSATTGLTACPIIDGVVYYKDTNNTYTLAGLVGSTAIGSVTNPIYWDGSKFAKTTYTLGKSVPSDAKFTDTVYSLPAATTTTLGGIIAGSGLSITTEGKLSVSKVPNALSINGKSFDGSAAIDVGVIGAAYGGSGKTSLSASANAFLNSLPYGSTSEATLTDDHSFYMNGLTGQTNYKVPMSSVYTYVKGKLDSVYQPVGSYLTAIPKATTSVLGGIKLGTGLTAASDGTVNVSVGGATITLKTWTDADVA